MKYFLSFISRNIFIFKFQGIKIIVPQSILDKYEIEILFSDIVDTWEELMIAFKGVEPVVYIMIEDLVFFLSNCLLVSIYKCLNNIFLG